MSKRVLAIALLAAIGLLAAACGSSDTPTTTPTATPTPTSPPGSSGVREITVTTENYFFGPSVVDLTPGEKVKFTVTNPTSEFHTFTIALSSGKDQILLDLPLIGGETQSAEFTVPTGSACLYLLCIPH